MIKGVYFSKDILRHNLLHGGGLLVNDLIKNVNLKIFALASRLLFTIFIPAKNILKNKITVII